MKKGLIIGLAIFLVILLAAGGLWYAIDNGTIRVGNDTSEISELDQFPIGNRHEKTITTDKRDVYETPIVANPLLVGLWYEELNPQHFKAYYDDPCDEEGYFWGKEWDEKEDILEEDLTYHGNGWFKWSLINNEMVEIYMSEQNNMVVPIQYLVEQLNDSAYVYNEFEIGKTWYKKNKKIPVRTFFYHRL